MIETEHNEKRILNALVIVTIMGLLSACALGYSAVLQKDLLNHSTPFLVRFFGALALGSCLCVCLYFGFWFYYRGLANRAQEDARRFLLSVIEPEVKAALTPFLVANNGQVTSLSATGGEQSELEELRQMKAS